LILNDIFLKALTLKASDIHFEPAEKKFKIRYRVDWAFIKWKDFGLNLKDSIVARLKIMSSLRIDEHRLPQDWKITYKLFAW
jgi:type II secretory ATPase GspE/PulE/Tfp pilus assembly ATPase PilB-like protein